MYLQHFALNRFPFETPAHSDELFASQAARETATRLAHLLDLRGLGLLTGEPGCGKTSVCRQVVAGLHPGRYKVCYVALSTGSVLDTYQAIGWELGLAPAYTRASAFRALQTEITRLATEARQQPLLVFDEAQHLRSEVLEDLRLLTNFAMDAEPRLCLLLVGLTELQRRLAMAVHTSLNQRIVVRQHMAGLARAELGEYVQHRLRLAGCEVPLLEPEALEALHQAAHGLPRQINRLAHYALAAAALEQVRTVSAAHVERARGEVRQ